jgi:hypothetical protein
MLRLFAILVLPCFTVCFAQAQVPSFSVDDLLTLSSLSPKKFDHYMSEKGFLSGGRTIQNNAMALTFLGKQEVNPDDSINSIIHTRTVNLYKKENAYCFAYHTSSFEEFIEGRNRLKKANFFYPENKDTNQEVPMLFQHKNITIQASKDIEEGNPVYTFLLKKKELPTIVTRFAEDLLIFDSHEYLATYFGEENVKKDVYYFSEKKFKKCSVLFGNSNRQVVFIWEDEDNLSKLSYILISGVMPTGEGLPFNDNIGRNIWSFKNGIYCGMSIRELLEINKRDFKFYGVNSEFSMMIEPENFGYIDFKRVGVMLSSLDGTSPPLLKKQKISAEEAVENHLALHVFYIMLAP